MFCLNLCEIFIDGGMRRRNLDRLLQWFTDGRGGIDRIYLGSSFCSQYFLGFRGYERLIDRCKQQGIPITLVLPVFSEKDLLAGKEKAERILDCASGVIDEITVNDVGMLRWVTGHMAGIRVNLGRLFFKDPRDCRVLAYYHIPGAPFLLDNLDDDFWKQFDISGIELDAVKETIDLSGISRDALSIGLHVPYCYMTTGNICKFASIHKRIEQKFRPNAACAMECHGIFDTYSGHIPQTNCDPTIYRYGRTLYYRVDPTERLENEATRLIYFPIDEWRKMIHEDIGSAE